MKKVAVAVHAKDNFDLKVIEGLQGLDFIHVDVMDGIFVKNLNLNLSVFKNLKNSTKIPIIAHLMVINPFDYIENIIGYIDILLFHYESNGDKDQIIQEVKKYNKEVGIVINPNTDIKNIITYLEIVDYVLIMCVNPGWAGQSFIPESINKVNELAKYKKRFKFKIIVDGGINLENVKKLMNADILSSSSTILNTSHPNLAIKSLKNL